MTPEQTDATAWHGGIGAEGGVVASAADAGRGRLAEPQHRQHVAIRQQRRGTGRGDIVDRQCRRRSGEGSGCGHHGSRGGGTP